MPQNVFLKFASTWADEMDVEGFLLVTSAYWEKKKVELQGSTEPLEMCVGSNQSIRWRNGAELLSNIQEAPVNPGENTELLQELFPLKYYFDDEGGDPPPEGVLAGYGEIGFLDNLGPL